ncbi:MAG: DUF1566 domain-containing protein, partial [Gammaproteobacteria bacterium]|nr:DUF1566 domain-containing protein [Gammaproteobacteria bacterium]
THRNFIIISLLATPVQVFAGNMTPPAGPASPASAMYTLQDICNRLDSGAAGVKRAGAFMEPGAAPAATGCSYDDVMTKAPAADNLAGAAPADVTAGKKFWGRQTGAWGPQTGTVATGANVNGANGLKTFTIPDALYSAGKTAAANDTNLVAGNIKSGITVFGVTGNSNVVDTSVGTAAAGDILSGKTAYAAGNPVTGTVAAGANVNGGDGLKTFTITDGLYPAGQSATANDANLVSANIKSGVTVFGVAGTHSLAAMAKSGQIQCYDQATDNGETCVDAEHKGQDGFHQKGTSTASRFTTPFASNGTVTDNLTGLIWLKNANCAAGFMTWWAALDFAYTLYDGSTGHNGGDCGLSDGSSAGDWRLPNVKELQSLIDFSNINPALPAGHPFSGIQGNYWSSTSHADSMDKAAWLVTPNSGYVSYLMKPSGYYVWPVRGGQ